MDFKPFGLLFAHGSASFFIIEEPESNLFPESQKLVIELISMIAGVGNAVLLTTHSPYVLGTVNNLLYADTVGNTPCKRLHRLFPAASGSKVHPVQPCLWKTGALKIVWIRS